jgi:hypothetical protein
MPSKKATKQQAAPEAVKLNINLPNERYHTATLFDGQVKITMWCYYSGAVSYTTGAVKRAIRNVPPPNPVFDNVPDAEQLAAMSDDEVTAWSLKLEKIDPTRSHFDTFAAIIPYLVSIEFAIANPKAVDEDLYYLHDWWITCGAKKLFERRDYEGLWESFLQYELGRMVGVIMGAWYMTRRSKMPASQGLTVGSAKETDPRFLADGLTTSTSSENT